MASGMSRRTFVRLTIGAAVGGSLASLVGCAPAAPSPTAAPAKPQATAAPAAKAASKPPVKIRYGDVGSSSGFPLRVAQEQGYFAKYNLDVEFKQYASAEAVPPAFRSKELDAAVSGLTTVMTMYNSGERVLMVFGNDFLIHDVLVQKDSPINSMTDLKGKKVGLFGGPAGHGSNLFQALCIAYYGFNPGKDGNVQFGAPPLLAGMVEKGEVAAVHLLDPTTSKLLVGGKIRSLGNIADMYQEKSGDKATPIASAIAFTESFTQQNPEAVTGFLASFIEGVKYLQAKPEEFAKHAKTIGLDDPAVLKFFVERRKKGLFPLVWDEETVAGQVRVLEFIQKQMGATFLDKVDKAALTSKFVPKA